VKGERKRAGERDRAIKTQKDRKIGKRERESDWQPQCPLVLLGISSEREGEREREREEIERERERDKAKSGTHGQRIFA